MSIDALIPEDIEGLEINTSGQYVLYCRHYPDTPEAACSMCVTQDTNDSNRQISSSFKPDIIPTDTGVVIPHPIISGLPITDLHDTYKRDRYDNLYDGHTTAGVPVFQKMRLFHND